MGFARTFGGFSTSGEQTTYDISQLLPLVLRPMISFRGGSKSIHKALVLQIGFSADTIGSDHEL